MFLFYRLFHGLRSLEPKQNGNIPAMQTPSIILGNSHRKNRRKSLKRKIQKPL